MSNHLHISPEAIKDYLSKTTTYSGTAIPQSVRNSAVKSIAKFAGLPKITTAKVYPDKLSFVSDGNWVVEIHEQDNIKTVSAIHGFEEWWTREQGIGKTARKELAWAYIDLPEKIQSAMKKIRDQIDPEDLGEDGKEDNPHITAKYGLTIDDPEEVIKAVANNQGGKVKMGKTSLFENEDADVLKVSVTSQALQNLWTSLSTLDNEDKHPDYQPHATLAYLKPGTGKKYVGIDTLDDMEFTFDEFMFEDSKNVKTKIKLEKQVLSFNIHINNGKTKKAQFENFLNDEPFEIDFDEFQKISPLDFYQLNGEYLIEGRIYNLVFKPETSINDLTAKFVGTANKLPLFDFGVIPSIVHPEDVLSIKEVKTDYPENYIVELSGRKIPLAINQIYAIKSTKKMTVVKGAFIGTRQGKFVFQDQDDQEEFILASNQILNIMPIYSQTYKFADSEITVGKKYRMTFNMDIAENVNQAVGTFVGTHNNVTMFSFNGKHPEPIFEGTVQSIEEVPSEESWQDFYNVPVEEPETFVILLHETNYFTQVQYHLHGDNQQHGEFLSRDEAMKKLIAYIRSERGSTYNLNINNFSIVPCYFQVNIHSGSNRIPVTTMKTYTGKTRLFTTRGKAHEAIDNFLAQLPRDSVLHRYLYDLSQFIPDFEYPRIQHTPTVAANKYPVKTSQFENFLDEEPFEIDFDEIRKRRTLLDSNPSKTNAVSPQTFIIEENMSDEITPRWSRNEFTQDSPNGTTIMTFKSRESAEAFLDSYIDGDRFEEGHSPERKNYRVVPYIKG